MLSKLLNHNLSFLTLILKRSAIVRSDFDLSSQMKLLNDNKQFKKALELFNKYKKDNVETSSSFIITQALKACAHLEDLQLGSTIHHLISSRVKDDIYISASLIHLYSKFKGEIISLFYSNTVQCGDVARAESLFDTTTKKTSSMYGAMMKGNNYCTSNYV